MTTKAKGNSVTQKLVDLQRKSGVTFANLATSFLIERLVARLVAEKTLRTSLVFKGGFVGLKIYESPRYTVDLDALLLKANIEATLKMTKSAAESDLNDGVWFIFEEQIDLATQGEYGGIRQVFRAGIGLKLKKLEKAQIINFDMGIGDPVTPGPVSANIESIISSEEISWSVYPIETIVAEKLHAVVSLGDANSRSKDVYDLNLFLPKVDAKILNSALKKCFEFRKTELPESFVKVISEINTDVLERGWGRAVSSVPDAPKFKPTFDNLVSQLKALDANFRRE